MTETAPAANWSLPGKVASYPTVSYTMDNAYWLYEATKSYNRLTQMTAGFIESTGASMVYATKPLVTRLEPRLLVADKMATERLCQLEEKAPIMKEEPDKILQTAKDATVSTINSSRVGKAVSMALSPVIGAAEKLAEDESEKAGTETESELDFGQTVNRAFSVGTKLQRRAVEVAFGKISQLSKRSTEVLSNLTEAVDLIQYAKSLEEKSGANKVREFLQDLTTEESAEEGEKSEEDKEAPRKAKLEKKTLIVSRNLTRKLGVAFDRMLNVSKPYISEALYTRLQNGKVLIGNVEDTFKASDDFKGVSEAALIGAKTNVTHLKHMIKELTLESLEYMVSCRPAVWMMPKDNRMMTGLRKRFNSSSTGSSYEPSDSDDEADNSAANDADEYLPEEPEAEPEQQNDQEYME